MAAVTITKLLREREADNGSPYAAFARIATSIKMQMTGAEQSQYMGEKHTSIEK